MSEVINTPEMRWLGRAPLALAAMMMWAAAFSKTNPRGGSSTCTNSCDCHGSFSSDAPTALFAAAPRPAPLLFGATALPPSALSGTWSPCHNHCDLRSAKYIATDGSDCPHNYVTDILTQRWAGGQLNFTATNTLMGGDPCPYHPKELNIEVQVINNVYSQNAIRYLQIPENTTKDLSPVCCVPR